MRKLVYTIIIMLSCITYTKAQWPTTDSSFALVWGDEFTDTTGYNGMNCNQSKWRTSPPWYLDSTKTNFYAQGWVDIPGYNLYYYYDTNNVHVQNGICRLKARKGPYLTDYAEQINDTTIAVHQDTFNYSNGSLTSRKKFRFGYYEIKFWLPSNITLPSDYNAYQPTFWMVGSDSVAYYSELDIYEIKGNTNEFTNGAYYKRLESQTNLSLHHPELGYITNGAWHTAAVDWSKNNLDYYLDGNYIGNNDVYADSLRPMVFLIEAYLPLFMGENKPIHADSTKFPYTYEIDYVRIYQRKEACDSSKTYLTTTASTFKSKLYQNLTLGGVGGNATFNNGNASALGTEYVLLQEGTTIDANMNMYIDVLPCNSNIMLPAFVDPPSTANGNYYKRPQ